MKNGEKFIAKDKLNNVYNYTYLGEGKQPNGYNIHLFNEDTQTDTYVEKEWFNQRAITK